MLLRPLTLIALSLGLLAGISSEARAASPWAELRAGISGEATAEIIGQPLLSTRGRGVEVWIYDHCGEVILKNGSLVGWSVPVRESSVEADHVAVAGAVVVMAARPQGAPVAKAPIKRPRQPATVVVSSY